MGGVFPGIRAALRTESAFACEPDGLTRNRSLAPGFERDIPFTTQQGKTYPWSRHCYRACCGSNIRSRRNQVSRRHINGHIPRPIRKICPTYLASRTLLSSEGDSTYLLVLDAHSCTGTTRHQSDSPRTSFNQDGWIDVGEFVQVWIYYYLLKVQCARILLRNGDLLPNER